MAVARDGTKQALARLEEQLTCAICLETYTQPVLLDCSHSFCRSCLKLLITQTESGPAVSCPQCRKLSPLADNGLQGLQPAFYISQLFELQGILERSKSIDDSKDKLCEKCNKRDVAYFCHDCNQFLCTRCMEPHLEWAEFKSHKVKSMGQFKEEVVEMVKLSPEAVCSIHGNEIELYCDKCGELACVKCSVNQHKGHKCRPVADVIEELRGKICPKLKVVDQNMAALNLRHKEVDCQREDIEATIESEFSQLQSTLEERKSDLLGQLNNMTQEKLDGLTAQREELKTMRTELSSTLEALPSSTTKASTLKSIPALFQQVQELSAEIDPVALSPKEEADMRFVCEPLDPACKAFGQVYCQPACPSKCRIEGADCIMAESGMHSNVIMLAFDSEGRKCRQKIPDHFISCELMSGKIRGGIISAKHIAENRYQVSLLPTCRGRMELGVQIEEEHIRGSPYSILAKLPISQLGMRCLNTIEGSRQPWGIAINDRGLAVVPEYSGHCVSLFDVEGKKVMRFGSEGSGHGQFRRPRCVAIDRDGNMLVSDSFNHRIQKFSPEGQFLQAVGRRGKKQLEFEYLDAVVFGPKHRLYVCDDRNHRVQILNPDLTFHSSFGGFGSGDGEMNYPYDIAFDSRGHLYLAESHNHRVQVFTADGQFLRKFGRRGRQPGELMNPTSIYIDSEDQLYLTEKENHRISIFTTRGEFIYCFGREGRGEVEFKYPHGITMNKDGLIFITDKDNDRIKIF